MKKTISRLLAMAAAIICAVSCVYPFSIDTKSETGKMVIEGDILIGGYTTVKATYSRALEDYAEEAPKADANVWIEDDHGSVYKPEEETEDGYVIDTRNLSPDRRYRLVVDCTSSKKYMSEWLDVQPVAEIDSLSYIPDEPDGTMNVAISMHSTGGKYYKWNYVEDWEYHSYYFAGYKYLPAVINTPSWNGGFGIVQAYDYGDNVYNCWQHNESADIMTFTTDNQTEDRFVDLEFYKISQNDLRLSTLYRIVVYLEPLSEDAYQYWENVKNNSEYNGSLFAPNPSEVTGNIKCVSDTTEFVFGFINAAQVSIDSLYIDQSKTNFYKYKAEDGLDLTTVDIRKIEWRNYYETGWLPVTIPDPRQDPENVTWARKRCVDCRLYGGTKNKPAGWPTQSF